MHLASLHSEHHFTSGNFVRDLVIGMSDGLISGSFRIGGGALGSGKIEPLDCHRGPRGNCSGVYRDGTRWIPCARGYAEHYELERLREEREVVEIPEEEKAEISRIFQSYEVTEQEAAHVVDGLARNPKAWVDFMMKFRTRPGGAGPKARCH